MPSAPPRPLRLGPLARDAHPSPSATIMTERDESDAGAQSAPVAADRNPGDAEAASPSGPAADPASTSPATADEDPGTLPDAPTDERPVEIGGQKGPEPTRYGDWEGRGRCTDF